MQLGDDKGGMGAPARVEAGESRGWAMWPVGELPGVEKKAKAAGGGAVPSLLCQAAWVKFAG